MKNKITKTKGNKVKKQDVTGIIDYNRYSFNQLCELDRQFPNEDLKITYLLKEQLRIENYASQINCQLPTRTALSVIKKAYGLHGSRASVTNSFNIRFEEMSHGVFTGEKISLLTNYDKGIK